MMTTVIISLLVLFGALLMGKMLKDMYPGTLFSKTRQSGADDTSSEA